MTLNSFSNDPGIGIAPGDILPGVTYSTSVGATANEADPFNIDSTSGFIYTGGFLDSRTRDGINRPLTVVFTGPVTAFGFDTDGFFDANYSITINFTSGPAAVITFNPPTDQAEHFFGFASSGQDIVSAVLTGTNSSDFAGFAVDNFSYTAPLGSTTTPEPGTWVMGAAGLGMLAVGRPFRRQSVQD